MHFLHYFGCSMFQQRNAYNITIGYVHEVYIMVLFGSVSLRMSAVIAYKASDGIYNVPERERESERDMPHKMINL